ncbi:MAG: haloacid dehalogenase-like hydrolase [Oscillospiraceae bacterium]|nr:haloacid dehalogenase-like hydrolase [Oscillospiraceae bacterium]
MQIDVYDFDGTVYNGDSSFDFCMFCLAKRPYIAIMLPWQGLGVFCMLFKLMPSYKWKAMIFSFLRIIDGEKLVKEFWQKKSSKIHSWFLPENRARYSVVASASPEFLLKIPCQKYDIPLLIGTQMDIKTGRITGLNCRHNEKVKRLNAAMPKTEIIAMYSDSKPADGPLFELAQERYHVVKGEINKF